jgi:hypothetical protein
MVVSVEVEEVEEVEKVEKVDGIAGEDMAFPVVGSVSRARRPR